MNVVDDSKKIDVIHQESALVFNSIEKLLDLSSTLFVSGISILSVSMIAAFTDVVGKTTLPGVTVDGLIASLAIVSFYAGFGVFFFQLHLLNSIAYLGRYRRSLEDSINKLLGEDVIVWENFLSRKRSNDPNNFMFVTSYIVVLVADFIVILVRVFHQGQAFNLVTYLIISSVFLVIALVCLLRTLKVQNISMV